MPFATSIMVAGCYKDDQDDGHELWYTGASMMSMITSAIISAAGTCQHRVVHASFNHAL